MEIVENMYESHPREDDGCIIRLALSGRGLLVMRIYSCGQMEKLLQAIKVLKLL